jgi:hypothetical protein
MLKKQDEYVERFHLAPVMDLLRALRNTVINMQIPYKEGKFVPR